MMRCPHCGTENADAARFCLACGRSLERVCPACGTPNPARARFCFNCGTALAPEAAPPLAGEERKLVTVLFADLVGSTSLAEGRDPEEWRRVQAQFFEAMRQEVERYGGTVEKYIGDAVMAVFGLPAAHEDDPERAVLAAARMQARVAALRERLGIDLRIRIGIATGEVVANPAAAEKGEFLVTGDVVNVAARLQQVAEPGTTLVAERTWREVRDIAAGEPLDPLGLRGRDAPVLAVHVTGLLSGRAVPHEGLRAPLIGRGEELAQLEGILSRVLTDRQPNLVTILGAPGVGKTRLAREFLDRAQAAHPDLVVHVGRCLPYGDAITYWPLAEILRAECGITQNDPAGAARAKLADGVRRVLPDDGAAPAGRVAAALGRTIGLAPADGADPEPKAAKAELLWAWRAFVEAKAAAGPLVLMIEDIHWADESLLDVLERLADRAGAVPLLILTLARPDLLDHRPGWGGGRRNFASLVLTPLSPDHSRTLLAALLASDVPAQVTAAIVERAEGNPFFTEEIVRMLLEDGTLAREGGRIRLARMPDDLAIPDSVHGVIAARLDRLAPLEKRVVQDAAVAGRSSWPGLLQHLAGGASGVLDAIDALVRREVLHERPRSSIRGEIELGFRHQLTREVAYQSIPRARRAVAHAEVARWIERLASGGDALVDVVAYHYQQAALLGGDEAVRELAVRRLGEAGRIASAKYALSAARRAFAAALDLASGPGERAEVLRQLGDVAVQGGDGEFAWQCFVEAIAAWRAAGAADPTAGARLYGRIAQLATRWAGVLRAIPAEAEVRGYIDEGLRLLAGRPDTPERARLFACLGFWPAWTGRTDRATVEEALRHAREAVRIAESLDDPAALLDALDALSTIHMETANFRSLLEVVEQRLAILPRVASPFEQADTYHMASVAHEVLGHYAVAMAYRDRAEAVLAAEEPEQVPLQPLSHRAWLAYLWGRWDDALACARRLHAERQARGGPYVWSCLLAYMAAALILAHRDDPGAGWWAEQAREFEQGGLRRDTLLTLLGALSGVLGDVAGGEALLVEALEVSRGDWRPMTLAFLAEAAARAGDGERFRRIGGEALGLGLRSGAIRPLMHAHRAWGIWHLAQGEPFPAREHLDAAQALAREMEARYEVAATLAQVARLADAEGERAAAAQARGEAARILADLGARRDLAALGAEDPTGPSTARA